MATIKAKKNIFSGILFLIVFHLKTCWYLQKMQSMMQVSFIRLCWHVDKSSSFLCWFATFLNDFVDELPPLAAASMWTRKDIKEFKESLQKDKDSVIKIGSGETVTVSSQSLAKHPAISLTLSGCGCFLLVIIGLHL